MNHYTSGALRLRRLLGALATPGSARPCTRGTWTWRACLSQPVPASTRCILRRRRACTGLWCSRRPDYRLSCALAGGTSPAAAVGASSALASRPAVPPCGVSLGDGVRRATRPLAQTAVAQVRRCCGFRGFVYERRLPAYRLVHTRRRSWTSRQATGAGSRQPAGGNAPNPHQAPLKSESAFTPVRV